MSLRKDVNKIYLKSLEDLEPSIVVSKFFKKNIPLNKYKRIFPISFGKAAISMMEGLLNNLPKNLIHKNPVVVTSNCNENINHEVDLYISSHPTPDEVSMKSARSVIDYIKISKENDLVIFLISGGGSSLLSLPPSNITLNEKIDLTDYLLKSGCNINEINIVRKHVSSIKGGKLAEYAQSADIISLIISDVINDDISSIASGPTYPDDSTFQDAINVLEKYDLTKKISKNIIKHLQLGTDTAVKDTPNLKSGFFSNVKNTIICSNRIFKQKLAERAELDGYKTFILKNNFEGEAKNEAHELIKIFLEKLEKSNLKKFAIISGGETVVKLKGDGLGGRNQEFALSFLSHYKSIPKDINWLLLSVGTDGVDGPTDAAGGIIDKLSIQNYMNSNLNIKSYLDNNDSNNFLNKIDSIYKTGPTGNNIADIQIILVDN